MRYKLLPILCLVAALLCFAGCTPDTPAETTPPTTEPTVHTQVESLTLTITDISELDAFPNLKSIDLSGSTCYAQIAAYIADHPDVAVTYTVDLGGTPVSNHATEATVGAEGFEFASLAENLTYLPQLTSLTLPGVTAENVIYLQNLYPDLALQYSLNLFGSTVDPATTALDLSGITPDLVNEAAAALTLLPQITTVELMDSQGKSELSIADVKMLTQAAPDALIHYTFTLFGKTVSTTDETITFTKQNIGNEGEAELRQALDILCGCSKLTLEDCGFDNEVLAQVRSDYPQTKVVWRIYAGSRSYMTDTDTIRAVYHVDDSNSGNFRYCNETKYMDLGHNTEMQDLSFISYMPDLEIVILSGSIVSDLSPFAGCTKLVFLELAYCSLVTDVSPLKGCTALENLNLSYTNVRDFSPLAELPLKQLCYVGSNLPNQVWDSLQAEHPDCLIRHTGRQPYGYGWRYVDNGYHFTDIYKKVREVFDYDAVDAILKQQAANKPTEPEPTEPTTPEVTQPTEATTPPTVPVTPETTDTP